MRNTLGGKMKEFSGIIDHLSEIFGEALKPVMEAVIALFKDLGTWAADNKSTILEWGNAAGDAFKTVTQPLQTLIALLKGGEMESAFLYIQLLWSRTTDRLREGTEVVKTFFGNLGKYLMGLFEALGDYIGIKVRHALDFAHFISDDEEYADQENTAVKGLRLAAANTAAFSGTTSAWTGKDSEATTALQDQYDSSSGANSLAVQAGIDLENQMAKSAAEGMAKAAVTDKAAAAVAHAAGIETQRATDAAAIDEWSQLPQKVKKEKHEKEANGASALEKGSAEAWTGIQDAIKALQGEGPAEETAENTAQIVALLQQGGTNLAMGFGTDLNGAR